MQAQTTSSIESVISIVDDDKAVRDALRRMLMAHGFTPVVFGSAEQFLTTAQPADTSCLILDVRMPGMTGLALHEYLMSEGVHIPTILITALPTSGERERALASGVFSYLEKPLSEQRLLDTVRDALSHHHPSAGENEPRRARPGV
jgi:FixJ family two-component response regulator